MQDLCLPDSGTDPLDRKTAGPHHCPLGVDEARDRQQGHGQGHCRHQAMHYELLHQPLPSCLGSLHEMNASKPEHGLCLLRVPAGFPETPYRSLMIAGDAYTGPKTQSQKQSSLRLHTAYTGAKADMGFPGARW